MRQSTLDLVGTSINGWKLKSIHSAGESGKSTRFLCECVCGNEKVHTLNNLRFHAPNHCGCLKVRKVHINKIGWVYGGLTIIDQAEPIPTGKDRKLFTAWLCRCVCGNEKVVSGCNLIAGKTSSCGCLSSEIAKRTAETKTYRKMSDHPCWQGYGDIGFDHWNSIQKGAYHRDKVFDITIEYVWELFLKQNGICALSGQPIRFGPRLKGKRETTASLDRIDSNIGYVVGNVQWVHKAVNGMKMKSTDEDFIFWCRKITEYQSNAQGI